MEKEETKATEEVQTTTDVGEKSEEVMIPQSQVGGIVAKETKSAIEKMLKDLGVEDVKSAKDGLKKFKEIQEAQKTEGEKAKEELENYKSKYEEATNQIKQSKIDSGVKDILKSLSIDEKHLKTITKLTDLSGVYEDDLDTEKLKIEIEKTLEEDLPMLLSTDRIKIGQEKGADKEVVIETNKYIDAYKKLKNK